MSAADEFVAETLPRQVEAEIALHNGDAGLDSIWSANSDAGTVSRIDPAANRVTATVRVGRGPRQLAIAAGYLWVSNLNGGSLQRIDY